jgi:hypothetical protein
MKTKHERRQGGLVLALTAAAATLTACGGGNIDTGAGPQALAAPLEQARSLAVTAPAVGALTLVSSTATGLARSGDVCAVSGDGSVVLFTNNSDSLLAGDANNFATDVFAKNLRTGAVARATTTTTGATLSRQNATCLGLTPDGRFAAFMAVTGGSSAYEFPVVPAETAIFVKDLTTGVLRQATPPLTSLPTTAGWQFAGMSSDGRRVAFVALPSSTYLGGYETQANGPARMLVSDLSNPASLRLINLEAQVRLSLSQASLTGDAHLSPDGRQLVFATQANYPELGDNNNQNDVFAVQVDTGALRRVNTDVSGNVITGLGLFGPNYGVQGFIEQGRRVVLYLGGDSSAGAAGLYGKHLDTGELRPLLATGGMRISGNGVRVDVSLSDAGTRAVFVRRSANNRYAPDVPVLRNLTTGQESNLATTAAGTVTNSNITTQALVSANGSTAVFANSGTNLGTANRNFELRVYAKTVAVVVAGNQ